MEAEQLYHLFENEVVPMFYDRDAVSIPCSWVARMRASMACLAPQFSTNRMVREYVEKLYLPVADSFRYRVAQSGQVAKELRRWDEQLRRHWHEEHWSNLIAFEEKDSWKFEVQIYLGGVSPDSVQAQVYADSMEMNAPVCETMQRYASISGTVNGYVYVGRVTKSRPYTDFTPRILACHPDACIPIENNLILWWSGAVNQH